jgi:hypothetical protein
MHDRALPWFRRPDVCRNPALQSGLGALWKLAYHVVYGVFVATYAEPDLLLLHWSHCQGH